MLSEYDLTRAQSHPRAVRHGSLASERILGALGWLGATDQLANVVRTASIILFVVALGLAALGFARARRA